MPRPSIVRILIRREIGRLKKNPSALAMLGLLMAIAFVMSVGGGLSDSSSQNDTVPAATVGIIYDERTDLIEHLTNDVPPGHDIRFEHRERLTDANGHLFYPRNWSIVQLRNSTAGDGNLRVKIRYADADVKPIAPVVNWLHEAIEEHVGQQKFLKFSVAARVDKTGKANDVAGSSVKELLNSELMGTALLLMVQFFCSCHLLVSFTAQDREHKTLHAIALTRARLSEIMLAKGIFHLSLTLIGSTSIAAIMQPLLLINPIFWCVVLMSSISAMCVGTCIATLAKNQAAAGMLALCYMMGGAVLFFLATKFTLFAVIKSMTIECYSFHLLYFAFRNPGLVVFLRLLIPMAVLTVLWVMFARRCFYRYGWK